MSEPSAVLPSGFELQPTLQGKLLELRPLRPEDWPDLFAGPRLQRGREAVEHRIARQSWPRRTP